MPRKKKKNLKILREFVAESFKEIKSEKNDREDDEIEERNEQEFADSGFFTSSSGNRAAPVLKLDESTLEGIAGNVPVIKDENSDSAVQNITNVNYASVYNNGRYEIRYSAGREESVVEPLARDIRREGFFMLTEEAIAHKQIRREERVREWHELEQARAGSRKTSDAVISAERMEEERGGIFERKRNYRPLK